MAYNTSSCILLGIIKISFKSMSLLIRNILLKLFASILNNILMLNYKIENCFVMP